MTTLTIHGLDRLSIDTAAPRTTKTVRLQLEDDDGNEFDVLMDWYQVEWLGSILTKITDRRERVLGLS